MKKGLILKGVFFSAVFILSSCAAGLSTRTLPYTTLPPPSLTIEDGLKGLKIAFVLFEVKDIKVSGSHREGLVQRNKPWDFMQYPEKKSAFYTGLYETVQYAMADEFKRQGFNVVVTDGKDINRLKDLDIIITGKIANIELNTYGSSDDYWEAYIILKDVTFSYTRDGAILWIGVLEKYCKLPNGSEGLDWTMFEAVSKFLQGSMKGKDYGDYFQKRKDITPAEIAARLSAIDMIKRLKTLE